MRQYRVLSEYLEKNNYSLTDNQRQQFDKYFEMLVEKNKVMNLTAITDIEGVEEKHFLDSASVIEVFDLNNCDSLVDIGTGAGFPGIPLKILFPHLKVVLADSLKKRVGFLDDVIDELGLKNISAVHTRAEDFGHKKEYRESFDVCVSRAVASLNVLSELCLPVVKVGGVFIPYKSGNAADEIPQSEKALKILGGKVQKVENIIIGPSELSRCFPVISKVKNTPGKYPRKAGTPSKMPL